MSSFKLCFIFDDSGDYKPIPYSKLMINGERNPEFDDRYFIPVSGYLLEVSREDYLDFYKDINRQRYLRSEAQRVNESSLHNMVLPDSEIVRDLCEDVYEKVISMMMAESLHKALHLLCEEDRLLIQLLFFDGQTEQHCADVFGIKQSTVNWRKKRAISNLKKIMGFNL